MPLAGKVAVITGGGAGIGRVYSQRFAAEGASVVVADIDAKGAEETVRAVEAAGGKAAAVRTDVADQASVQQMAHEAIDRFGRIDILVNKAALFTAIPMKEFDEIEVDEWDRVMAVNLRGPFLCAKAVLPHMREQGYGKIVNISSAAVLSGNPRRTHYITSKMGLIGFTRSLARVAGKDNITINAVLPGSTASESTIAAYGGLESFQRSTVGRAIPRVMVSEDLVGAVLFFSSPESDLITGQSLVVDGGTYMQ